LFQLLGICSKVFRGVPLKKRVILFIVWLFHLFRLFCREMVGNETDIFLGEFKMEACCPMKKACRVHPHGRHRYGA
jgi:hypothetical protein